MTLCLVTLCIYMVVALEDVWDTSRFPLGSSAPAMWFAPAIILLSAPFAAAFVVSLVLVTHATRLLISRWVNIEPPIDRPPPEPVDDLLLFHDATVDAAVFTRGWAWVLIGSLTAQAGVVALLWRHPLRAAACLATSTAIVTALAVVTGAYRPRQPPALPSSLLSIPMTFVLAAALSFGGMVMARGGFGGSAADDAAESGSQGAAPTVNATPARDLAEGIGGDFPGVILLPELLPHVLLVAPPGAANISRPALPTPEGIPFTGEYWMFRPPRARPPRGSFIRRGTPSELSFHTTDGAPLEMEAHQKVDPPVDVRCCTQIQLLIANTDPYPGTVSLELVLMGSEVAGRRSQSLGTVPVESAASFEQTLSFPVPPVMDLRRFDEFKVVFHRDPLRGDRSARIAIERFVLVP